jgi:hypothetical protein
MRKAQGDASQLVYCDRQITLTEIERIETYLKTYPDMGLVIFDPIQSYLGGNVDMNKSNATRAILDPLNALARKYKVAILLLRHLAKGGSEKAIYRGLGSIDFTAASRSTLALEEHPHDPTKVYLCHIKSNVGPLGRPQVFSRDETGAFQWWGVSELNKEAIMSRSGPEAYAVHEAIKYIRENLPIDTPTPSEKFIGAQAQHGWSSATMNRAKKALRIKSKKDGETWYWLREELKVIPCPPGIHETLETLDSLDTLDNLQSIQGLAQKDIVRAVLTTPTPPSVRLGD